MMLRLLLVTALGAWAGLPLASARPVTEAWLQAQVDDVRAEYELPALGAGVAVTGTDPVIAVSGTVSVRSSEAVEEDDAWHIGSNTKALTALLYARVVEEGKASWENSVAELFAGAVETIDPAWQEVAIRDLLAHRSGIGQVGPVWLVSRHNDEASLTAQRLQTMQDRLAAPPPGEVGAFVYSNLNYIAAGAAIEAITAMSWEDAMREYVFGAEGGNWSRGWGFGPPQSGPVGHDSLFGFKVPADRGSGADNPQALGPAGTVHVPIRAHLRLLAEFIDEDSHLVTQEMRTRLLSPWPDETADYAMGWGVAQRDELGRIYVHRGSNTMWLSHVELIPAAETVLIVNTNIFTDASREAVGELVAAIETRLAAR